MSCQFVGFDSGRSCGRGTLVVVPILVSRSVGSRRMVFVAIRLGEWVFVVQVSGFFSVVGAQTHDGGFDVESVH